MICSSLPLHVFPDSFLACFLPLFSMHLGFFPVPSFDIHLPCIFQQLSINCPHIFHPSPFPPFPAFCSSTPLHFHQFCILFVHPFSSPFHPAISHELFTRIPFPFRSRCPVLHVLPVHFPASRFLRAIPLTFISFTSSHSCFFAFPLQPLVSHRQHV